jgi:hypothetical protein
MAEDALATALEKALKDPASKPDFFRLLLASSIIVIGQAEGVKGPARIDGAANLNIGTSINSDGVTTVPFFSGLDKLQAFIKGEETYLTFSARTLFEATRGADLFLNPRSASGWIFKPDEVESLLKYGTETPPPGAR